MKENKPSRERRTPRTGKSSRSESSSGGSHGKTSKSAPPKPLVLGGRVFAPGESGRAEVSVGTTITQEELVMPVIVARGKEPGPCVFISSGIHGDEINGVEITSRIMEHRALRHLRGDVVAIPVVNVPAFMQRSRYLPDRRDLNRLFPGISGGSMGARIARTFVDQIVKQCTHGIDLHSGAVFRPNLPQVRASSEHPETIQMAKAFGAPVILDNVPPLGSLRSMTQSTGVPIINFEGGEAMRLDMDAVRAGVRGVLRVLRLLKMISPTNTLPPDPPFHTRRSTWLRAPVSGVFTPFLVLGAVVKPDDILGQISSPFSTLARPVVTRHGGVVIGMTYQALVDEGDALFHVAIHPRDRKEFESENEDINSPDAGI